MMIIIWYFIKVIIGSGILTGYYFLALRNKVFHRWNRFYLLISVVLALALPLVRIDIFENEVKDNSVVQLIKNINSRDESIVRLSNSDFVTGYIWIGIEWLCIVVILFLAFRLIYGLYKIYQWKRLYPKIKMDQIEFLDTDLASAPFSFFNSIFWNRAIDVNSSTGKQILCHELSHVKELHTYDKVFMNVILVLFWMNPFFYIIKKEISMIHEFIADQAAVKDNDVDSYSGMILKTIYPNHHFSITNNFFYSPLKRRLFMLVKNQNPSKSYIGRIIAIPLLALIFSAFTLKIKEIVKTSPSDQLAVSTKQNDALLKRNTAINSKDSIPDFIYQNKKVSKVDVNKDSKFVTITFKDGTKKTILKKDMPPPPPPPVLHAPSPVSIAPPPPPVPHEPAMPEHAFYILNGVSSTRSAVMNLDPAEIKQVSVLKGPKATSKYGSKAKNGAIEVITDGNLLPQIQLEKVNNPDEGAKEMTFTKVEQEASFPGGSSAWVKYITYIIKSNISSLSSNDQGTCRVRFVVEKDGSVSDVQVLSMKGTKLGDIAVNAIKDGPKWNPAVQNGHIVRAYREQPVSFSVQDN